jgi:hypothetical protein
MNDGEAPARHALASGGLVILVDGILAGVGWVYLLTRSAIATGIAAGAAVAVVGVFWYFHR